MKLHKNKIFIETKMTLEKKITENPYIFIQKVL